MINLGVKNDKCSHILKCQRVINIGVEIDQFRCQK